MPAVDDRILGGGISPRRRTMREFAEQELTIRTGRHRGTRFNCDRQPFTGRLLDAIDSGKWPRIVIVGPVQSGKTFIGFTVPILYHVFELHEPIIVACPTDEIMKDKWENDLLPAIEDSRYANLLPTKGTGSRGGRAGRIDFKNGAKIRFMTGGGGPSKRASYESRVVMITEVDKFVGESKESDKISQLEDRTAHWDLDRRIYLECTVTEEQARSWYEYKHGTNSRLMVPCRHCAEWIRPEREHLVGWRDASNVIEAQRSASFVCPACGVLLDKSDRKWSNRRSVLTHEGQTVSGPAESPVVEGEAKESDTLGFRWSAFDNEFATPAFLGNLEYKAREKADELDLDVDPDAEKNLCHSRWCVPYRDAALELVPLTSGAIRERLDVLPKRRLPSDTVYLTIGVDPGLWAMHYLVIAWRSGGRAHIPDYGVLDVHTDDWGPERALQVALREFRDTCRRGWDCGKSVARTPDAVFIDSGYAKTREGVYAFCREQESRGCFYACRGFGESQSKGSKLFTQPSRKGNEHVRLGEQYFLTRLRAQRQIEARVNADHWKSWLQERMRAALGEEGSMGLFHVDRPQEHTKLSHHLTSEKQVQRVVAGEGLVTTWEKTGGANHWLDCAYYACAAGHFAGWRLVAEEEAGPAKPINLKDYMAQANRKTKRRQRA